MSDEFELFLIWFGWALLYSALLISTYLVAEIKLQKCLRTTHLQQANPNVLRVRYYNLVWTVGWSGEHSMRVFFKYWPRWYVMENLKTLNEVFNAMANFGLMTAMIIMTSNICLMLCNLCEANTPRYLKTYSKWVPIVAGTIVFIESSHTLIFKKHYWIVATMERIFTMQITWCVVMSTLWMLMRQLREHERQMGGGDFIKRAQLKMYRIGFMYTFIAVLELYLYGELLFRPGEYMRKDIKYHGSVGWKGNVVFGLCMLVVSYHSFVRRPDKKTTTTSTGS